MTATTGALTSRWGLKVAGVAVALGVAGVALVVTLLAALLPAVVGTLGSNEGGPSSARGVPAHYLHLDEQAAATCPGLPWSVLAAIGDVESGFGSNEGPSSAGALGPMQFEPGTFARFDHPVPADPAPNLPGAGSPPSITNPADAVYAAARDLCANGARSPGGLYGAVFAYNHAGWYVQKVLTLAHHYRQETPAGGAEGASPSSPGAAQAVAFARSAVGTPYLSGATGTGGSDGSGLAQAAWAAAGVSIPPTAEAQWARLPHVRTPRPGDLVFFAEPQDAPAPPNHVGIYIGHGQMIDAPHRAADVRVDPVGRPRLVGYGRP